MIYLFDISIFHFSQPLWLLALLLIPLLFLWEFVFTKKHRATFFISDARFINKKFGGKARWLPILKLFRYAAITFIILALARPQSSFVNEHAKSEGIDIMLSLDISGSMLAQDFKPNRIDAAKRVANEFIQTRIDDKIGLVIFSGESLTQCPLTTDKNILLQQLENVQSGSLQDGTAIGMGLATAVNGLRNSNGKSRIIILLTDGVNNAGLIDPMTALEIAKTYKIKVYTIGVGSQGNAPYPVQTESGATIMQNMPVQIDEALLQKISAETRGKYFRAKNNNALAAIYTEIDKLEKSEVEINSVKRFSEKFYPWAFAALFFLLLENILRYAWFRTFP